MVVYYLVAVTFIGGRRFNIYTYKDAAKATGSWGEEVMPQNMTGKQVNACNGGILIVPAKRIADGKKLFCSPSVSSTQRTRDSVGFFYKELASYADYSTAKALGSNWKKVYV